MNRDTLNNQSIEYLKGYADGVEEGRFIQKRVQHRHAWGKLFLVIFCAAFAGILLWNLAEEVSDAIFPLQPQVDQSPTYCQL
jgi:hypothetical protein